MKKITLYGIFIGIFLVAYLALLICQGTLNIFPIALKDFWFPLLLLVEGVILCVRGILLKSGSTIWFALVLLGISILMLVVLTTNVKYEQMWPMFVVILALACMLTGFIFRDWLFVRLAIALSIICAPLLLFSFGFIKLWAMLLLTFLAIALGIVLVRYTPERWTLFKK